MSFTASDVVNAARDRHPAFDPKTAPDAVAWRFLQQFARTLASEVVQRKPEALVRTALVTTLPLAAFGAGITIPTRLIVDDVSVLRSGGVSPTDDAPVRLVHPGQRFTTRAPLFAYLVGDTVQLGGVDTDWMPYTSVTVRYVPVPTVTDGSTALPFDDDAMTPCVLALADFLGQRRQGMSDAPPPNLWTGEAFAARTTYLTRIQRQGEAEETVVQNAYNDNGGW